MSENLPVWTKFLIGGASGISGWMFVHPFDLVKVRLQINQGKMSPFKQFAQVVKHEGFRGLYGGLSAAIARQVTYSTMRIGLYDSFRDFAQKNIYKDEELPLLGKLSVGLAAGGIGAFSCNPVEVSLVRMQADMAAAPELRRGYKHVFDALIRIGREEGVMAYFRGAGPTVARGMVVSMTQLGTYDHAKHVLLSARLFDDGVPLHLAASLISGLVYCSASLPLDICKTRMQNQKVLADGTLLFRNIPQTLAYTARTESVFALWKGFLPYFARGGGHTVAMFLFMEQYRKLFCWGFDK